MDGSFLEIIVDGVCFNLTPQLVRQFHLARKKKSHLSLSPVLLSEINDYVNNHGDILAFYTYYNEKALIKTMISLSGNLNNYYHRDCLKDADLGQDLAVVHHWLIAEFLGELKAPVVKKVKYDWLSWLLSFVIVAMVVGLNLKFLIPFNPVYVALIILGFVVLRWIVKGMISLILRR